MWRPNDPLPDVRLGYPRLTPPKQRPNSAPAHLTLPRCSLGQTKVPAAQRSGRALCDKHEEQVVLVYRNPSFLMGSLPGRAAKCAHLRPAQFYGFRAHGSLQLS